MIIVDTGFWLALVDQKDTYHQRAKQTLKQYNETLITTWCVVTETCYLLLTRKGVKALENHPLLMFLENFEYL